MNITLWIIQSLLGLAFCAAGVAKLAKGRAALLDDKRMAWASEFSSAKITMIGLAEVLGGIGLIFPLAVHVMPFLTPVAASALSVLMIGAVATHLRRKEPAAVPVVLTFLSLFVAIERFRLG